MKDEVYTEYSVRFLGKDVKLYIPTVQNIACWIISYKAKFVTIQYISVSSYLSLECEL